MKRWLGLRIMRLFSDRTGNFTDNPNHNVMFKWHPYPDEPKEYYCCVLNSESPSDQVWLGRRDKWFWFYSGPEFRRMALWVLWRWIWHDWLGLKTRLWLIGLHWY